MLVAMAMLGGLLVAAAPASPAGAAEGWVLDSAVQLSPSGGVPPVWLVSRSPGSVVAQYTDDPQAEFEAFYDTPPDEIALGESVALNASVVGAFTGGTNTQGFKQLGIIMVQNRGRIGNFVTVTLGCPSSNNPAGCTGPTTTSGAFTIRAPTSGTEFTVTAGVANCTYCEITWTYRRGQVGGSFDTCDGRRVTIGPDARTRQGNIIGTDGDDVILGSSSADFIDGKDGDDRICGAGGADTIKGGPGNDVILGQGGRDKIRGGSGDDFIHGGKGRDTLRGGSGDDVIEGGGGRDKIFGGKGDDDIGGGNKGDTIKGGPGFDFIEGNGGQDVIEGGSGGDVIEGGAGRDSLFGGKGDDDINGGSNDDLVFGGSGSDVLIGEDGSDDIFGGPGADYMFGHRPSRGWRRGLPISSDPISDDRKSDYLFGGKQADSIHGGAGPDVIEGNSGNDILFGGRGRDTIKGGPGNDFIRGGPGRDDVTL